MGNYSSFILKLWVEPESGWRWGVIEHVATRERVRFLAPQEILDFIAAHAGSPELALPDLSDGGFLPSPGGGNVRTEANG